MVVLVVVLVLLGLVVLVLGTRYWTGSSCSCADAPHRFRMDL